MHINRGGLKASICIHGQYSNIIFGQYIFISKVAEFSLFGCSLAEKVKLSHLFDLEMCKGRCVFNGTFV